MKFLAPLALVLLTPCTVVASGASITAAINKIDVAVNKLNVNVNNFKNLATFGPVAFSSFEVIGDILQGTRTAQQSAPLTQEEAIALVGPVNQLVTDTQTALGSIQNKAGTFKSTGTNTITAAGLRIAKASADQFVAAVIAKVPQALQGIAANLAAPLDPAFDQTIAALS